MEANLGPLLIQVQPHCDGLGGAIAFDDDPPGARVIVAGQIGAERDRTPWGRDKRTGGDRSPPVRSQLIKSTMMMISQIGTPRSQRPSPRNMIVSFLGDA
jgi:hypothetical protein